MTGVITSLPPVVQQPPGSASSNPAGLPGVTYQAAIPNLPQTWSALQTFLTGDIQFSGSTSGNTLLNATAIASGTVLLPAVGIGNTDTLVGRNTVDTLTNKTLTSPTITGSTLTGPTITGATITTSTYNGNTWTAGTGTLTIATGKTETFNNTLTFAGTDGTTLTFQGTDTYVGRATTDTLTNKTFDTAGTGNSFKINGTAITAVTGTGSAVLATSPTLVTPVLGTPTSGTLTNCTGLPLTGLANQAAWTFLFNNTSGSAAPTANTIDGLTLKASPAAGDEVIIWDVAGAAIKKTTVSGVGAAAGVSSIAGNTGAFTLGSGLTNSGNIILEDTTMIGEIKWFPFTRAPNGNYLRANGAAVLRSTYATLLANLIHSSTVTFTNGSADITWNNHGLSANDKVKFYTTGSLPTNFTAATSGYNVGTEYVVLSANLTTNTFRCSATAGQAAISAGSAGSGTQTAVNAPWGDGDGSTTFTLPNLVGDFIRAWQDGTSAIDSNRVFGAEQLDAGQGHLHTIPTPANGGVLGNTTSGSGTFFYTTSGVTNTSSPITDGTNGTPRTASETRPRNNTLSAFIRVL